MVHELGSRSRRQPAPAHVLWRSLRYPDEAGSRPWLELRDDEVPPRVVAGYAPTLLVWSSLWPHRPLETSTEGREERNAPPQLPGQWPAAPLVRPVGSLNRPTPTSMPRVALVTVPLGLVPLLALPSVPPSRESSPPTSPTRPRRTTTTYATAATRTKTPTTTHSTVIPPI